MVMTDDEKLVSTVNYWIEHHFIMKQGSLNWKPFKHVFMHARMWKRR